MGTRKVTKARSFAFIIYPDSLPDGWDDRLIRLGIPMAISPLHDKDKSERLSDARIIDEARRRLDDKYKDLLPFDRGVAIQQDMPQMIATIKTEQDNLPKFKKAHYHVLYVAPNPVTTDSVRKKLQRALGPQALNHVEIVDNIEGYYLYLTHESEDAINKGKHKYDKADIRTISNFDVDRYIVLDRAQKKDLLIIIKNVIRDYKIANIIELEDFIAVHGEEHGLQSELQIASVVKENVGYLRLYFDAAYQIKRRGAIMSSEVKGAGTAQSLALDGAAVDN